MKKIGMLTIGQSPRDDLIPGLMEILGDGYEIVEAGALDDHIMEDIEKIELNPEHYILVSRMRDGTEIKITKKYILPLMQKRLDEIESQGVRVTVVMCTGKFPQFKSKGLVVTPSEILKGVIEGSLKEGKLGVVYPAAEQMPYAENDFGRTGVEVYADTVSPYEPEDVEGLLERLKKENLDLIFLNCFGFPSMIKEKVITATGKPTIQSNTLIARVLKELISG
ncbi:MAG: AroM family protein [Candidatus Bathyarchaeota archaeon]|nr:AroM family protein [Candidatus Bathyarchaeota archaeon]